MAEVIEIVGQFIAERRRFENPDSVDVIIGEIYDGQKSISIKGPALIDELRSGQSYVFYGKWGKYKNRYSGETVDQFTFQSFIREAPASREAVISYLSQHGEGIGVGKARATNLWESFGPDAVRICREQPSEVVKVLSNARLSISIEQAEQFAQKLTSDVATEKAKLSLASLLQGRGFPKSIASTALQEWGNKAAQIIRRDPYRLMRFKSCGFKRCDAMYLDLKLNPARLKRQALCAWYSIARDTEGSTWYPMNYPVSYIQASVSGSKIDTQRAIQLAVRAKALAETATNSLGVLDNKDGTKRWFAEHSKAEHERQIAQSVVYSRSEQLLWPDVASIGNVTDHQRERLGLSLQAPICILGGSPGTGKTWTLASLIELIGRQYGFAHIAIGAPTGKAAVRVTEQMAIRGIPLQARTWHSLLLQLDRQGFSHFPYKFLIGDEWSMMDTDLTAAVFRARAVGTHLLLVGDINQLPPVGHGAPLRDLIAAGVCYGELRNIERNDGGIVQACAAIRDGRPWKAEGNLILDSQSTPEGQIAAMLRWLKDASQQGIDPVWECQPLVAVNKSSPLSRKEMNKLLQHHLNHQPGIEGMPFRNGDKLVNTENKYFPLVDSRNGSEIEKNQKGEVYVANGELAKVLQIDGRKIYAELQSPHRIIEFFVGPERKEKLDEPTSDEEASDKTDSNYGCSFELGYALSTHKMQGSDAPWVLTMLDEYGGARRLCDRSWIYTAISRAKSKCILIGKKSTADAMCKFSNIGKRKTFLKETILQLQSIEELAGV